MEQLRSILEKVILKNFSKSSVHGLNRSVIPPKKLENVKALHNIKYEDVWFIYDATLFGSAKDGIVFTEQSIYWREVMNSPQSLDYREIIESTANKDLRNKVISVLGQEKNIEIKETYYHFICDLRAEMIRSSIIYETYYKSALQSVEGSLIKLCKQEQFGKIIDWLDQYKGLFLNPKHKSVKIREISFQVYLEERMFAEAHEQLEFIEDRNPRFYKKAISLLELAIKEERYSKLEIRRLKAIEIKNFEEAYLLFEEQKAINIRKKDELSQIELEIKEAHFKNLGKARLRAMEEEEYDLAFSILDNQKELMIRQAFEIERIRNSVEQSKRATLKQYMENLNIFLEDENFIAVEQIMEQICTIEPAYPLEREKILVSIYSYDFNRAKGEISQVSNPTLKLELEKVLQKTREKLQDKIRNAAKYKQYDIFERYPDIWNYKDEYGMSALYYFALEADLEGILKALDHTAFLLIPANIFGHNFIDLIGFACDPILGRKEENPLSILEQIKNKVDIKPINERINFLKTGQEGNFFSYQLSQEERLYELNQKLMSMTHFQYVLLEIENQTNNHVDKIMKHLFAGELEAIDTYPIKDEFETAKVYARRCKVFKKQYLDRADFIAEYKRQNQPMVEGIAQLLKDEKNCFIPKISAIVEYKNKKLNFLRSLATPQDILELMELYFPTKSEILTVEIGNYDAEREVFLISVNGEMEEMRMPLAEARELREKDEETKFVRRRIIKDDKVIWGTVPK